MTTTTIKNNTIIFILFSFLFAFVSLSHHTASADTLRGRDYVRLGKPADFTGVLAKAGDEWVLDTEKGSYEIHLGPVAYREYHGFSMKEGDRASVKGFLYKNHVAVAEITTGGKTIILRKGNGSAAWSGSRFARGKNRDFHASPRSIQGDDVEMNKQPEMEWPKTK